MAANNGPQPGLTAPEIANVLMSLRIKLSPKQAANRVRSALWHHLKAKGTISREDGRYAFIDDEGRKFLESLD